MCSIKHRMFEDFEPLGGSRPDCAVTACAAMSYCDEKLPPDVLDVGLALLCAPLIVAHAADLEGREVHFRCPIASVRLRTMGQDDIQRLRDFSAHTRLTVKMELNESVTAARSLLREKEFFST